MRQATAGDAEAIARIWFAAWRTGFRGLVPDAVLDELDLAGRVALWQTRLAPGGDSGAVTLISGPGYCRLALPSRDADATGDVAEIASMYVAPADQGQGVGRALMRAAFELAAGYRDVTLWVWERNAPARRFYERCGFAADGARQDDPGTGLVDVRMRRGVQAASA